MSYTRTGAGPFARRLFIPEERIEKICRESLASSGLLPEKPEAIRIDRLIFLKFGFEEEYLELPAHIMGCAKFRKTGITRILVNRILAEENDTVSQRRVRSTLAHEIGHGLFHADLFTEKLTLEESGELFGNENCESVTKEGFVCRAECGLQTVRAFEWWEHQANLAMSSLLLPLHLITMAAKERLTLVAKEAGNIDFRIEKAEREIAEVFDVNRRMVRIRLGNWWRKEMQEPTML